MSQIVTTADGRFAFRRVTGVAPDHPGWLWRCPCGEWASLSDGQWNGRVSVDHVSDGCRVNFHETHNFGAMLVAAMQSRILMGEPAVDEQEQSLPEGDRPTRTVTSCARCPRRSQYLTPRFNRSDFDVRRSRYD